MPITKPKGTYDVLPTEVWKWNRLEMVIKKFVDYTILKKLEHQFLKQVNYSIEQLEKLVIWLLKKLMTLSIEAVEVTL